MAPLGKFDVDASALAQRIRSHDAFGSRDLNQWVLGNLDVAEGLTVLDLGCGMGRQSLPLARLVGVRGRVVSVDVSADALRTLSALAEEADLHERILPIACSLDDAAAAVPRLEFDRVLGVYSLYYAKNPEALFRWIHSRLKSGGILFFCGPSAENNAELKRFHDALSSQPAERKLVEAAHFMEHSAPQWVRTLFSSVTLSTFENPLRFDSPQALFDYWSSYNLFDETLVDEFRAAVSEHFRTHSCFETVKRVVGVKAVSAK